MRTIISGRLAAIAVTATLAAVPTVASAAPVAVVTAHASKTCSNGYTHARINGVQKCLRAGEFCVHRYDHRAPHRYSYRHYGFRCIRYYSNVDRYRLTYAS